VSGYRLSVELAAEAAHVLHELTHGIGEIDLSAFLVVKEPHARLVEPFQNSGRLPLMASETVIGGHHDHIKWPRVLFCCR